MIEVKLGSASKPGATANAQQFGQLGDIGPNASRLIAHEVRLVHYE